MIFCSFLQILFACAEALYAHGYSNEACRLTVELARDLLANPPDLKVEQPPTKVERWQQPSVVMMLVQLCAGDPVSCDSLQNFSLSHSVHHWKC